MKQYSFLEEKHNLLWKTLYGKSELARLRGARKVADSLNKEPTLKTKITSSALSKGPVQRDRVVTIVHPEHETGFGKNAMIHPEWTETQKWRDTIHPSDGELRQIGHGKRNPGKISKSSERTDLPKEETSFRASDWGGDWLPGGFGGFDFVF